MTTNTCLFIYIAQFYTTRIAQSASQSQAKKQKDNRNKHVHIT